MKLRTQLALAFFVTAIVPLTGIVLFNHHTSSRLVRDAVENEAAELAARMDRRMKWIRGDIRHVLSDVARLPLQEMAEQNAERPLVAREVVQTMADVAPFVQTFTFVPPAPPAPPATPPAPAENPAPDPAPSPHARHGAAVTASGPEPTHATIATAPPSPIVIRIDEIVDASMIAAMNAEERAEFQADMAELREEMERQRDAVREEMKKQGLPAGREVGPPIRVEFRTAPKQNEAPTTGGPTSTAPRPARPKPSRPKPIEIATKNTFGTVRAEIDADQILEQIFSREVSEGEIAFAIDPDGHMHASDESKAILAGMSFPYSELTNDATTGSRRIVGDWVVATRKDAESGIVFGIARPIGTALAELRRTSARNFVYGLGLIGIALLGIVPLAGHMSADVRRVTEGAEMIAAGDLKARVPVQSRSEIGRLAATFNRMAAELENERHRLIDETERRRRQEIEAELLEAEYRRKSEELEGARAFQLSLLPQSVPEVSGLEIATTMQTATEVGGDYYDFRVDDENSLTVAIGDGTGHGARAGTMVTVIKSLFSAEAGPIAPASFLDRASRTIERMRLGRMSMALAVARIENGAVTIGAAAMPPVLIYRSQTGTVEERLTETPPLGLLRFRYREESFRLEPGDQLLFYTDGLPELASPDLDLFGYERVRQLFANIATRPPEEVLKVLTIEAKEWSKTGSIQDDITLVAIRRS